MACFRFSSRMSLSEWASDGECAVAAELRARKLSRVGRLGVEKGAPDVVDSGSRACGWKRQA